MQYYNSQGVLVEFDGLKSGHYGHNSEIMRLDDGSVYKRYFSKTEETNHIALEVFEFIKQMANKHMVKLIERFYNAEGIPNPSDIKDNPERYIIDAYTFEWVEKENINIIDMPTDYLTDNLRELILLADYLSAFGLYMLDIMPDNAVLNKNGIVLIDPDIYTFESSTSYKNFIKIDDNFRVKRWNRKQILKLFRNLFYKALEMKKDDRTLSVADGIFGEVPWTGDYDVAIVSKKLKGFSTLGEYIHANKDR
ncbi:MAG: hypothetical protein K2G03_05395 [Bacilli bacterium]|nr:hypothetical protein [Bacilli bacterium]